MSWRFKRKENGKYLWACDFYTDLQGHNINNFLQYGQPFDPYEPGFDHEFHDKKTDFTSIEIEMTQNQVMYSGYGRKVALDDFPVVDEFFSGKIIIPDGKYTFNDLLQKKLTYPYARFYHTNLYNKNLIFGIDSGTIPRTEAAYVHGSVGFSLVESTIVFSIKGDLRTAEAEIKAVDDNFDYHSASGFVEKMNPLIELVFGPTNNNLGSNEIAIKFTGPGRIERMEKHFMRGRGAVR